MHLLQLDVELSILEKLHWIGFVGKIWTGKPMGFYHQIYQIDRAFRLKIFPSSNSMSNTPPANNTLEIYVFLWPISMHMRIYYKN